MTKEELAKKWNHTVWHESTKRMEVKELFLSDLNEVIRDELIKYTEWWNITNKEYSPEIDIDDVDEYLKSQQR